MEDPNVFAVLIPRDSKDLARDAFRLDENAYCYHKPIKVVVEEPANPSREPTPAPQRPLPGDYDSLDHVLLTFDKIKDPKRGWQLGKHSPSCDVLLQGNGGISRRHLHIKINNKFYVELHDDSTHGTAVGYDGEAKSEVRKKDQWILSFEPGIPPRWEEVIIYVPNEEELAFEIEFPNHHLGRNEYMVNLQAFLDQSRTTLPSVGGLDINTNPATAAPSQSRTPRQRPIYLGDEEIGRGEFGEVHRVIKARNGEYYAVKKFSKPSPDKKGSKKRKLNEENWLSIIQNEITIMKENPHVSMTHCMLKFV